MERPHLYTTCGIFLGILRCGNTLLSQQFTQKKQEESLLSLPHPPPWRPPRGGSRRRLRCTLPPPWDKTTFFVFYLKVCLPHQSVMPFLSGVPPPRKIPGSAPATLLALMGMLLKNVSWSPGTASFNNGCRHQTISNASRILSRLVYTTQVNSAFCGRWLASSEVISQVLKFTSEQPKKNRMAFVSILSQIKLLFGPLVIQLVWYILKQLFTSLSVKVVDIYLHFGE